MTEFLRLMVKPFVACLILTSLPAYLGLHVIEREVIFVDLALAQIAAFGATLGVDLARLTVYRRSGQNWWKNPFPAYRPERGQ